MRRGYRNFNLLRSPPLAYNPQSTTERIRLPEPAPSPERYALAVITDDDQLFPEVRKHLVAQSRTILAATAAEPMSSLELPDLHATLFNPDRIGYDPRAGTGALSARPRL